MLRRLCLIIIAILCFLPNTAHSSEAVRVLVLPFEIHAVKDLSYMQTEISDMIKKDLKQEGAVILKPEMILDFEREKHTETIEEIRNVGVKSGADYVVWGSLTWIGQKFILVAKMIESFGEESVGVLVKEGQGIGNVPGTVKQLVGDMSLKLFKREKVAKVLVTGNKRIEGDAIKKNIKTKPGDVYIAKSLSQDLKAVYSMGYFEDIRIDAEESPQGKVIIFKVKEKATIRIIRFQGNKLYKDDEIKENLSIRTGSILNIFKVRSNIKRIEELYKEKNYHNVKVSYTIHQLETNQADLEFIIQEGENVLIRHIIFEGNNAYKDKKLKKMMETSEKGFFSWMTSSGELNRENLEQDIAKLSAFYYNNGYIQAKVGEPQIEFCEDSIDITIKIVEGPRFKVGKVNITGDLILSEEELKKKLKITKETYYNREIVRNDVLALTDLYSDEGYAHAEISPRIDKNLDELIVNIAYVVAKRNLVYFENIVIGGNKKTRDKVIRRELMVYEQELFNGRGLKRSVRNLYRLDYFEDIKINTVKGSADDKMILKIDVTEKPTGTFSFGAGYSTTESVFGMASITQNNLFGRGQILGLDAQIGGTTTLYKLNFTEPWLFDIPLSARFDLYDWETDYDTYDKKSRGGGFRFSYPVYNFMRASIGYNYEVADIDNISENASESIKDLEGKNTTSSITTSLVYDSRNKRFNPTKGSRHIVSVEYAGLGGDVAFTKYLGETGWYIPVFKDIVTFLHGEIGYVQENSGGILPDYERFYLGGLNSLRGYDWQDIYVLDENGDEIGGDKFVQFNVELIFPLLKKQGLVGLLFYDTGNVYNDGESIDLGNLRQTAGFGFRWYSPMGPIRLERGFIIDDVGSGGQWEFGMGTSF
ncbi:MAG: outer membrane protein assembly factor BamA [Desulfobacterales bacterium S5133MH16]|nr:MAG: outer membrane protein assembly factor BamA [Desulfobacterales bacterium S5133MH16]